MLAAANINTEKGIIGALMPSGKTLAGTLGNRHYPEKWSKTDKAAELTIFQLHIVH